MRERESRQNRWFHLRKGGYKKDKKVFSPQPGVFPIKTLFLHQRRWGEVSWTVCPWQALDVASRNVLVRSRAYP
jgi:hypothetical protein